MEKLKVLIADDSVVYRSQIRAALLNIPSVEVVGAASNGRLALERLAQSAVDLLILDLEMPEMDGIQTLREMKEKNLKCKVLVFSSFSKRGADITLDALHLGASDFITKPSAYDGAEASLQPFAKILNLLGPKIHGLFPGLNQEKSPVSLPMPSVHALRYHKVIWELLTPKIVVIGSSTGGPTVLEKIFSQISGPLKCPIVIAQHMPPIFTATLAERLAKISGIPAKEGVHGEILTNSIYLAPGDYHLRLEGTPGEVRIALNQGPLINSVRPAVDPLFSSAAAIFKDKCLGLVLTGMGADGKDGAEDVKKFSGAVVIQEEKSCVVFGMPGAVFKSGAFDRIATPEEMIQLLNEKVAANRNIA